MIQTIRRKVVVVMILPIVAKWFLLILQGIKKEEYREDKPYYETRILNVLTKIYRNRNIALRRLEQIKNDETAVIDFGDILFRNGYRNSSPSFIAQCELRYGTGNTAWGAVEGKKYFVFMIQEIKGE